MAYGRILMGQVWYEVDRHLYHKGKINPLDGTGLLRFSYLFCLPMSFHYF